MIFPAIRIPSDFEQDLEALADVAEGRVISGEVVHEWLRSWGTADELPVPRVGLSS